MCKLNLYIIRFDSAYSGMLIDTLFGHHLLAITLQLWCCQYQVNAHSHLQGSLVIVRGLSKGRWGVGVRVHILYPSCTLTLEEGTQGYTNTLEIFEG